MQAVRLRDLVFSLWSQDVRVILGLYWDDGK